MFFASFTSKVVTRSPNNSLPRGRCTGTVVVVPGVREPPCAAIKQPTPAEGAPGGGGGHGRVAREAVPHVTWSLLKVNWAVCSAPGSDWKTLLTRTSIFGTT